MTDGMTAYQLYIDSDNPKENDNASVCFWLKQQVCPENRMLRRCFIHTICNFLCRNVTASLQASEPVSKRLGQPGCDWQCWQGQEGRSDKVSKGRHCDSQRSEWQGSTSVAGESCAVTHQWSLSSVSGTVLHSSRAAIITCGVITFAANFVKPDLHYIIVLPSPK